MKTRFMKLPVGIVAVSLILVPASTMQAQRGRSSEVAGLTDGWAVDPNTDQILLTAEVANRMACGGAKWIRVPFRLGGHRTWDETLLGVYDQVVANCLNAGLKIIGLVNHESWPAPQQHWTANNAECFGGNGDNPYLRDFVRNAVLVLARRYHVDSRVTHWEIWNEPDVWTVRDPATCPGARIWIGGSYIYPSNFAWMLRRVYEDFKSNALTNATVISGGLLSADFTGTCDDSGRVYLTDTYNQGRALAGWESIKATHGSYPLDGWAQHMYVSLCCRLDDPIYLEFPPFLIGAEYYRFYLDCFREAAVALDGDASKKVYITEWGWPTDPGGTSQEDQAFNVGVAMDVYNTTDYIGAATYFKLHDEPAAGLFHGLRTEIDAPKEAWGTYCQENKGRCCID